MVLGGLVGAIGKKTVLHFHAVGLQCCGRGSRQ